MSSKELQQQLFQNIKSRIKEDVSAADEIAALLDVSSDSAYQRIRGEKQISLEELVKLCTHYKISLDQLLNIKTGSFVFQGNLMNPVSHRYDAYLKGMMHTIAYFASSKEKQFYYLCKDVPIFYHWTCREFATFKYFFWMSILMYFPEFRNRKVNMDDYSDELWQHGKTILSYYNQIDSFELWNIESLNATLHQIDYYQEAKMFESDNDVYLVYESLQKTLEHLEEQATLGYKFDINDPLKKPMGKIHMYFNEIIILDNSMLVVQDNMKMALVQHSVINYMMTRDVTFCENLDNYIQNLLKRSTLISETSEKERARFFRILRERIARRKEKLNV
jgi:hypothetical protein